MINIHTLSIHANGKKALQKELKKEIRLLKFTLNPFKKRALLKKLKDSDYYNF